MFRKQQQHSQVFSESSSLHGCHMKISSDLATHEPHRPQSADLWDNKSQIVTLYSVMPSQLLYRA